MTYPPDELQTLRRLTKKARSALTRLAWRAAFHRRVVRIATLLRMLPTLVPETQPTRTKSSVGWDILANGDVVIRLESFTRGRTLTDLEAPVGVRVLQPAQVNITPLLRLQALGHIKLEQS